MVRTSVPDSPVRRAPRLGRRIASLRRRIVVRGSPRHRASSVITTAMAMPSTQRSRAECHGKPMAAAATANSTNVIRPVGGDID